MMHTFKNISLILLLILISSAIFYSNKNIDNPETLYKVQIAFEPDLYNGIGMDTVVFSKTKFIDSSKNSAKGFDDYVAHQSGMFEAGELTISAISVYERQYSKTIAINSDTTVIFHKADFSKIFEGSKWDKNIELQNIDTVVIYSFYSCCAITPDNASYRKISCFKNDTNYLVKYTNQPRGGAEIKSGYITKKMGSHFIEILRSFYADAKKVKERKSEWLSTNNNVIRMRINNKIVEIADFKYPIGSLYDKLIQEIND